MSRLKTGIDNNTMTTRKLLTSVWGERRQEMAFSLDSFLRDIDDIQEFFARSFSDAQQSALEELWDTVWHQMKVLELLIGRIEKKLAQLNVYE